MRIYILLVLLASFLISCQTNQKLNFIPLTQFYSNTKDGVGTGFQRSEYYIVQNFARRDRDEKQLDSFVNMLITKKLAGITTLNLIFYKESARTNLKNLKENSRDLVRYAQDNDLIYTYHWTSGKNVLKETWKDGLVTKPKYKIDVESKL